MTGSTTQATAVRGFARLGVAVAGLVRNWTRAAERQRSRAALARLDAHLLRDIGLSTADVARETAKPFFTE